MTHPPGLVGLIAQDTARFSAFYNSLLGLEMPPGTLIDPVIGHQIPYSRNILVKSLLSKPELQWLFFLDDDHMFKPDLLMHLLCRDVAYVSALCLMRLPPYWPIPIEETEDGPARLDLSRWGNHQGLIPILRGGGSGLLVRREVFETLEEPWFEYGKIQADREGDDTYLTDKARMAGFDTWCDLGAPLGHMVTGAVWPILGEEGWTYGFSMAGGASIPMEGFSQVELLPGEHDLVKMQAELVPQGKEET